MPRQRGSLPQGVIRKTVTGQDQSHGASTNDNRAIEMRGWRWVVSGNEIHTDGPGEAAISVDACRVNEGFPCRNVKILHKTLSGTSTGIAIRGIAKEQKK